MRMRIFFAWCVLLLSTNVPTSSAGEISPAITKHFDFASQKYGVPKELLLAIAKTESNLNAWAINIQGKGYQLKNKAEALALAQKAFDSGKSFDIGLMQINVWWLKKYNIDLSTALEPQNNVILGAFVLKHEIMRHGLNWKAVASYHTPLSRNPARGRRYAAIVIRKLKTMRRGE